MDEYLSEKEQIEAIRSWWRENGWYLVGGAAVAGLAYFGYGQYQAYENGRAERAADLYLRIQETLEDDRPGADDLLAQLASEYGSSPYTDQARLLIARDHLISDPSRAVEELRTVMETSTDPGLAMVARLRLARVLAYRERYREALNLLAVEEPGEFTAQLNAILGDIQLALGDTDAARRAYTVALTGRGSQALDRNLLQMKLSDLAQPPAVVAPAAETPPDSEAGSATSDASVSESSGAAGSGSALGATTSGGAQTATDEAAPVEAPPIETAEGETAEGEATGDEAGGDGS